LISIHYPLILAFEEPTVDRLKETIERLQNELKQKSSKDTSAVKELSEQNEKHKQRVCSSSCYMLTFFKIRSLEQTISMNNMDQSAQQLREK